MPAWLLTLPAWALTLGFAVVLVSAEWIKAYDGSSSTISVLESAGTAVMFFAAGLFARRQLPSNRTWLLLMLAGVALASEDYQLARSRLIWTLGQPLANASGPVLMYLALAFPSGRLTSRVDRAIVGLGAVGAVAVASMGSLFFNPDDTTSLVHIAGIRWLSDLAYPGSRGIELVCVVALVAVLARRWVGQRGRLARMLVPYAVLWGLIGWSAAVVDAYRVLQFKHIIGADPPALLYDVSIGLPLLLPLAFAAGVVALRLARASVGERMLTVDADASLREVRDALAEATGERGLRVLAFDGDGVLRDDQGDPMDAPPADAIAARHGGETVGWLLGEATLREDPQLLEATRRGLAAVLAKRAAAAQAREREAALARAREDAIEAADAARRRVERDLHDGAQQRLVALALELDGVRTRLGAKMDPEVAQALERTWVQLSEAVRELRHLAVGAAPPDLGEHGLDSALEALLDRCPSQVRLHGAAARRFDPRLEATAYFVVSEAVTNALKHSGASRIEIGVQANGGELRVSVQDDGRGLADPEGAGLRGLRARVEAQGGTFAVSAPATGGTLVAAVMPIRAAVAA
jgi:signal transduction histidine kinase